MSMVAIVVPVLFAGGVVGWWLHGVWNKGGRS